MEVLKCSFSVLLDAQQRNSTITTGNLTVAVATTKQNRIDKNESVRIKNKIYVSINSSQVLQSAECGHVDEW